VADALARFDGEIAYVDAVILVAYLDQGHVFHQACRAFVSRAVAPGGPIALVTATLTLDEVVFVLLQELVARPPYGVGRDRARHLERHPDTVRALTAAINPPVRALVEILQLEPVTPADIAEMAEVMAARGLLPRDAIHYAVARRLGITAFVSDDDAFDGLPGIRLYKP
jgi:predicted nucleic acid-binding protein